jgi:hypothetical protein
MFLWKSDTGPGLKVVRLDLAQKFWREDLLPAIHLDVARSVLTRDEMIDDIARDYQEFRMRLSTFFRVAFAMGPTAVR